LGDAADNDAERTRGGEALMERDLLGRAGRAAGLELEQGQRALGGRQATMSASPCWREFARSSKPPSARGRTRGPVWTGIAGTLTSAR